MKKTIITVFAFLVIFGFAVSGAMAQTWSWSQPITITATEVLGTYVDIEFSRYILNRLWHELMDRIPRDTEYWMALYRP